jgi:hypothetical protein
MLLVPFDQVDLSARDDRPAPNPPPSFLPLALAAARRLIAEGQFKPDAARNANALTVSPPIASGGIDPISAPIRARQDASASDGNTPRETSIATNTLEPTVATKACAAAHSASVTPVSSAIGESSKVDKPKSVAGARRPRKPGKGEA